MNYTENRNFLPSEIKQVLDVNNVFYSTEFENYLHSCNKKSIYVYSNSFILLFAFQKKYIFRYVEIPSELICYKKSENESEIDFINDAFQLLKNIYRIDWTSATSSSALFSVYPRSSFKIPFGSYICDLKKNETELWEKVHSKHRNSIRKAEKDEVSIEIGGKELLNIYMELDSQTWGRSKINATPIKAFEQLIESFNQNLVIVITYYNSIAQGGAIFLYNKKMSYYLYGATKNNPSGGSMNFLHWEMMKYFKKLGVEKYSFVGGRVNEDADSKYHDIQRFKSRFGGEFQTGFMFKITFNKYKFIFYKLILKFIYKTIINDPIDQEIHKWKEIN